MSEEPPPSTTYCRQCGTELDGGRSYCPQCGAPQDTSGGQGQPGGPPSGQGQGPPGGPPAQGRGGQQAPPPQQQAPPPEDDGRSTGTWIVIGIAVVGVAIFALLILAPILAAFVLGLGDTTNVGPQASFDYTYAEDTDELTVTVTGGDSVEPSQVTLEGSGFNGAGTTWAAQTGTEQRLTAGDQITLTGVEENFDLQIVWRSPDGEDSNILSTRTGPGV